MNVPSSDHADNGPSPVDHEGQPLSCHTCAVRTQGSGAQCAQGHACLHDRYAPRIERFFRSHPQLADQWLTHPYFETRAIAARYASVFRLEPLLRDPDETVRR